MNNFWLEYNQNGEVQEFTFDGPSVAIGRDKSSDFVLDHPTVSRQHAVIRRDGPGQFVLRVLSRGGLTAIDGQQVQGEVPLHDGANINLGKLSFRFRSDNAPQQPQHNLGGAQAPQGPSSSGSFGAPGGGNTGGGGQQHQGGGAQHGQGGQANSGFGSGSGNSGFGPSQNQGGAVGGFAQSSFGGGQQAGGAAPGQNQGQNQQNQAAGQDGSVSDEEPQADGPDIVSWDDIASSEEAMKDASPEDRAKSVFERMEEGQKKQEETRPGLIIVAGIAIVGLMAYIFLGGGTGGGAGGEEDTKFDSSKQLEVEVECLGKADCVKKAKSAYNVGNEKLEKAGAAISNRFEGYKSLLEAEEYLEESGMSEPPPSMTDLEQRQTEAKAQLDALFRNFHVAYHQAKNAKNHQRMAESLSNIISYFPDKKAPQHQWAQGRIRWMKQKGIYPAKSY
ncbi:MAG: FHA domain-containing protein [Myxococcota bacterium]